MLNQLLVESVARTQTLVRAALGDLALVHDDYEVGVLHCRQSMRNHEHRATLSTQILLFVV